MSDKLQPTQNNLVLLTKIRPGSGHNRPVPSGSPQLPAATEENTLLFHTSNQIPWTLIWHLSQGQQKKVLEPRPKCASFFFLFSFFSCLMKYKSPEQPVPGNACTYCWPAGKQSLERQWWGQSSSPCAPHAPSPEQCLEALQWNPPQLSWQSPGDWFEPGYFTCLLKHFFSRAIKLWDVLLLAQNPSPCITHQTQTFPPALWLEPVNLPVLFTKWNSPPCYWHPRRCLRDGCALESSQDHGMQHRAAGKCWKEPEWVCLQQINFKKGMYAPNTLFVSMLAAAQPSCPGHGTRAGLQDRPRSGADLSAMCSSWARVFLSLLFIPVSLFTPIFVLSHISSSLCFM